MSFWENLEMCIMSGCRDVVIWSEQQVSCFFPKPVASCHIQKHVMIWIEKECRASWLPLNAQRSQFTLCQMECKLPTGRKQMYAYTRYQIFSNKMYWMKHKYPQLHLKGLKWSPQRIISVQEKETVLYESCKKMITRMTSKPLVCLLTLKIMTKKIWKLKK